MSLFKARPWYFIWEKAGMNGEKESIIIKLKGTYHSGTERAWLQNYKAA